MALTDSAVLIPGQGAIWTGVVGTATKPTITDLAAYASAGTVKTGWTNLGHTSIDDILAPGQDGGDSAVKGSWQNSSLRTVVTSTAVDYFVIKSLQIKDNTVLSLYYGGGDATTTNEFAVPDSPTATNLATCILLVDGTDVTGIYMPKASWLREDSMEFDSAEFTTAPMRVTALKYNTNPRIIWINDALGA